MTYGANFTADQLNFLRARDAVAHFAIDTRVQDAFRNGLLAETFGTQAVVDAHMVDLTKGVMWAMQYGWSVLIHVGEGDDDANALAETMGDRPSLKFIAWHPYVQELGGIVDWREDESTGRPSEITIRVPATGNAGMDGIGRDFHVAGDRLSILTWGYHTNHWMGLSCLSAALDPILGSYLWQGTAIRRQRDYATARWIVPLPMTCFDPGTGLLRSDVETQLNTVFSGVPYVAVPPGLDAPSSIGGPLDEAEEGLVLDHATSSYAAALAITKADITGAEAGQKLSVDANDLAYAMTSRDIQKFWLPAIQKAFERMGVVVTGFRSASELSPEKRYVTLGHLMDMYNRAPPSVKPIIAQLLQSFLEAEFGIQEELDVASDLQHQKEQLDTDPAPGDNAPPAKKSWWNKKSEKRRK
ncbi:MAG: hypothetical protein SXV54_24300 [Chloroflexota bacterium]|nr:hypothetical protein [Chloroflexota bacterium]